MKHDMILFAIEVHHQYAFHSSTNVRVYEKNLREKLGRSETISAEERELFVNYLDVYFGLKVKDDDNNNGYFQVTRK